MAPFTVKELIGEVARRHGVLLGQDDPILVSLTLNELIVGEYVARMERALVNSLDQLSGAQTQHIEAAREIASEIVTRAAEYGAGQIEVAVDDLVARLRGGMIADVAAAREAAHRATRARDWAMWAVVGAAALLALAIGLLLGRVL